jgi:general stress protein 26
MEEKEPIKLEASLILDAARETIRAAEFCFLITLGKDGKPNARLMQPFPPESELVIWFGVSSLSRKVQELRQDPLAVVAYQYNEENAYVSMRGHTKLIDDIKLRRQYWRESWLEFYPGGPESDEYMLVRFEPERVDVMNFSRHIHPPPFGLAAAKIERQAGAGDWTIVEA